VAGPRLGAGKKGARRRRAFIALIDESGLLLGPLLRRSWAPRGRAPALLQRGRRRDKVSVAAAMWLTPSRDRLGLSFQTLVKGYYNNERVAAFLEGLLAELAAPVVAVWDGGNMHKGDPVRDLVRRSAGGLVLERLPPYGAELMPLEWLWAWLKHSRMCNFAPRDAEELNARAVTELTALKGNEGLLRGFFRASSLPLPRTLLS
jgi:transposase